ncbi:hypothetical protein V2J09_021409 [Rumex salicifolius]
MMRGLGSINKENPLWVEAQLYNKSFLHVDVLAILAMAIKGQTGMAMWLFFEMRNSWRRPDTSVYERLSVYNALITAHLYSRDKTKALDKVFRRGYYMSRWSLLNQYIPAGGD